MNRTSTFTLVFLMAFSFVYQKVNSQVITSSPNKKISISFMFDNNGAPMYSVSYNQTNFIQWSKLGLNFVGGYLGTGLTVLNTESRTIDETYSIVAGKSSSSRNYCNETKITLQETGGAGRVLEIYFRAYDDGAAFRYGISGQNSPGELTLSSEETNFNFAGDYECWTLRTNTFNFNYEGDYYKTSLNNIGNVNNPNDLIAFPLVIRVNRNLYVCVSEANITNYPGMYLQKSGASSFKSKLVPYPNDNSISATVRVPFVTPWRMFIIAGKSGGLVESNLVMNLNEPQAIDASWIVPGKSVWDWWSGPTGFDANFGWGMNEKTFKYYIDFAASNNIQYVTIDAGWYGGVDPNNMTVKANITKSIPEVNIEELARYANSKGVGIIVWMMWNHLNDQLDEALDYYGRIGLKGIKTDFMNREDQEMVGFYHRVLKKAAENRLLVNFHGAYKPDGLNRTYPNLITREAVLGAEYSKWDKNYPNPTYNVTIPFTRMLLGAMDYTPGGMRNTAPNDTTINWALPVARGTRAHQLASFVVFESPLQTLSESPEVYKNSPDFAFIKECPTTWASTRVLSGAISEYIVIARKSGNNWFVGAMTNSEQRDLEIDFSFLGAGTYSAEIYTDASDADRNPQSTQISRESITKSDVVSFHLARGGGLAIILRK